MAQPDKYGCDRVNADVRGSEQAGQYDRRHKMYDERQVFVQVGISERYSKTGHGQYSSSCW